MSMSRMSKSFYLPTPKRQKVPFQTKYKQRGTNEWIELQNHQDKLSRKTHSSMLSHRSRPEQSNPVINTPQTKYQGFFNQGKKDCAHGKIGEITMEDLARMSMTRSQFADKALDNDCSCGRHVSKLVVNKPQLKKSSTYRQSFRKAKKINLKNSNMTSNSNASSQIKFDTRKQTFSQSLPKVQMGSTYSSSFRRNNVSSVEKHRPNDLLHFEGPNLNLTSYRSQYPGNRGGNPYIKPKQLFSSGDFTFRDIQSIYQKAFTSRPNSKTNDSDSIIPSDQLKTGYQNFFKESFYQDQFQPPNPEDFAAIQKPIQKHEEEPNFSHQFETTYDNDFVEKQQAVCPAKINLQSKLGDFFANSKEIFGENADFKAMSKSYHAMSLAPYGQYQ